MKHIDERLSESCKKTNWEVKTIKKISIEIYYGSEITRDQLGTGDYPAIKCGDINSQLPIQFTECISFVDHDLIKKPKYFEHGDLLISDLGGEKTIGKTCVYLGNEKCLAGNVVSVVKHNQNPRYLAYALSSGFCRKQIEKLSIESTVFRLYSSKIKQIKIPVPPKEVQDKIANYLDKFYELERELEDRKKQYEYYKNQIFHRGIEKFGWEIKLIEEIATEIYSGSEITRDQLGTGDYPAIKCGDINSQLPIQFTECISFVDHDLIKKPKYFEYGDVLISALSNKVETLGKSRVYLGKERCLVGNDIIVIKYKQNPKYLAYALSSEFCRKQIEKLSVESTVFHLYSSKIKQMKTPIPSLENQEKEADKLDKFQNLINKASGEIPILIKEIRQKYENSRDVIFETEIDI